MKSLKIAFLLVACLILIYVVCIFLLALRKFPQKTVLNLKCMKKDTVWGYEFIGQENRNNHQRPVKIAILDSGINKSHKEFENLTFYEFNATNPDKPVKDEYGHGTAIAGIIAARGEEIKVFPRMLLYMMSKY